MGDDRRGRRHCGVGQAIQLGELPGAFLYCILASSSYLALEIYAVTRPEQSQALLARARAWIDAHTDQAIIAGSLILGLWLMGNSIYLIVS